MDNKNKEELTSLVWEQNGASNQLIVTIEELSELIKELTKLARGKGVIDNIAEEIADVKVTVFQVIYMLSIDEDFVNEVEDKKWVRLSNEYIGNKEGLNKQLNLFKDL